VCLNCLKSPAGPNIGEQKANLGLLPTFKNEMKKYREKLGYAKSAVFQQPASC
jgi:hypothetical protein